MPSSLDEKERMLLCSCTAKKKHPLSGYICYISELCILPMTKAAVFVNTATKVAHKRFHRTGTHQHISDLVHSAFATSFTVSFAGLSTSDANAATVEVLNTLLHL